MTTVVVSGFGMASPVIVLPVVVLAVGVDPGDGAVILSATPAQGYQLKDVEPQDGGQRVRFETGGSGHNRVEMRITCVAGNPTASTK